MRRTSKTSDPTPPPPSATPDVPDDSMSREEAADAVIDRMFPRTGAPSMGPGYERIQTRLFTIDVEAESAYLEEHLRLPKPAHLADYAILIGALDEAEDCSRRAHRVYVNAKLTLVSFEADLEVLDGTMRDTAMDRLTQQKASGERAKAITNDDVRAMIASLFPDEVRAQAERRAKAKLMVEHFEWIAQCWKARARELDTMLGSAQR